MKKAIWIAVLTLAALGVAYGEAITLPHGETRGTPAPGITTIGEAPLAEAGASISSVEVQERVPVTPPMARGAAEEPPGRRAPATQQPGGYGVGGPRGFTFGQEAAEPTPRAFPRREVRTAYKFKLMDPETGAMYGPFPVESGKITVGEKIYKIEVIQYSEEVEEVPKTREQVQLEEKLRKVIVPEFSVEEANLKGVADFLSKEGDVNIVVVDYGEQLPSITLKLKNVPLYDIIRYVTEVADLTFRIDDHAVVIKYEH